MNQNQISSISRLILNVIAGALATHGLQSAAGVLNSPDVIALAIVIVTALWSHFTHADPPATPPPGAPGGTPQGASPSTSPTINALVLVGVAALLFGAAGCKSTPQQVAYQTAGTAIVSVDTAMNLWGAYVAANHPGAAVETKVKAAFDKYQAAMATVCDAGAIYSATGTTNAPAAAALNQAVASAGQSLLDLENLLTALGVKLK